MNLTIRAYFLDICYPNTGSKFYVVDTVQFRRQISSFISILMRNVIKELDFLGKVLQFQLGFKLKFYQFFKLAVFL